MFIACFLQAMTDQIEQMGVLIENNQKVSYNKFEGLSKLRYPI